MRHDQRDPRSMRGDRYSSSESNFRRDEQRPSRREASERRDWYERDEMDERSGYRDEEYRPSSEYRDASDYRRDFNYSNQDYGRTQGSRESSRGSRSIDGNRSGSSYEPHASGRQDRYGSSIEQSYDRSDDRSSRRGLYGTSDLTRQGSDQYRSSSSFDTDRERSSERGSERGSERSEGRSQFFGRGPKSYKRSDERIKEDVCEMLTRDNNIDAEGIEVEVKEGEVTLTGTVPERRMKHLAEDCAEGCYGVKDVTNNIRVSRESSSTERDSSSSLGSERSPSMGTSGSTGTKKSSSSSTSTNAPNH
ncbi:BON domain-containing protein [Bdellovibrio bacteriovorus]|uniref:BON domain-containing protein n=1 Tax=Bdellovibrio bacteriovorus TaxID=959 RepID=UPI003AA90BDE